jgi:hypothetical protein
MELCIRNSGVSSEFGRPESGTAEFGEVKSGGPNPEFDSPEFGNKNSGFRVLKKIFSVT